MNTIDKSGSFAASGPIIQIEDEMQTSYMNYAMSVIMSRALPDVRDGLKPVHRRILYSMYENSYDWNKPHRKSARVVGDVIGKYHPHGDQSIYDAMVRMAQTFAMSAELIDGQGNFGSIDGDSAAAMRYTEARMSRVAHDLTDDLDKATVDFRPNYDGSETEPVYLPSKFPNILVNGGTGIAVGMATNIPPHNIGEVIDACLAYIANSKLSLADLMKYMPGPDFPTRGMILGRTGIKDAYETGRGSITMSGRAEIIEGKNGRQQILISELPYSVNKAHLIEAIAAMVNLDPKEDKHLAGISDIRDESDRNELVRIVIDVKRDGDANVILSKLKKRTKLVTSFGVNMVCLNSKGQPRTMNVLEVFREFVSFRRGVIRRRTIYEVNKARDNLHKQIGLFAAVSLIDEVVRLIRASSDTDVARAGLMAMPFPTAGEFAALLNDADPDGVVGETFFLSETQASAILSLSLRNLTGLERDKIAARARELSAEIAALTIILDDPEVLDGVMKMEMVDVKAKFPTPRRTEIINSEYGEVSDDDLVERKDIVVTITNTGYVKRTDLDLFREQARGGKGKNGMTTKDDDYVIRTLICTTHSPLVFFTTRGIAHSMKAYHLPDAPVAAKGRPIVNYLTLRQGETISAVVAMPEGDESVVGKALCFVTDFGSVRRSSASAFASVNKGGKIAINLEDEAGNQTGALIEVLLADPCDDIMLSTKNGLTTRFQIESMRQVESRTSTGVRGMQIDRGDKVISACILPHVKYSTAEREAYFKNGAHSFEGEGGQQVVVTLSDEQMQDLKVQERFILTVTEAGFAKRSSSHEYRVTERGGKGFKAAILSNKTGSLVVSAPASDDDGIMLITTKGQTIRIPASDIKVSGRATRGVKAFNVVDDGIASAAVISNPEIAE